MRGTENLLQGGSWRRAFLRHYELLGYPALGLIAIGSATIFTLSFYTVSYAIRHSESRGAVFINSLELGLVSAILFVLLSSIVAFDYRRGHLVVANGLIVNRVPTELIERIDPTHGLEVVLVDGGRIRSIAFGRSVLGEWFGYRRARRVTSRFEAIRAESITSPGQGVAPNRGVRWAALASALILVALICGAALIGHSLR